MVPERRVEVYQFGKLVGTIAAETLYKMGLAGYWPKIGATPFQLMAFRQQDTWEEANG